MIYSDAVLFLERPIDDYLAGRTRAAINDVTRLGRNDLLLPDGTPSVAASAEVVAAIVAAHSVELVDLHTDAIEATPITEIDGVMATSVIVPFTGHPDLFQLDANHYAPFAEPVRGTVGYTDGEPGTGPDHQLVFWIRSRHLDTEFDTLRQARVQELSSKLVWVNRLVADWNAGLRAKVAAAAQERADLLARMVSGEAAMTVPIRRRSEPAIPLPLERRELPTRRPGAGGNSQQPNSTWDPLFGSGGAAAKREEPWMLEEAAYEEVLRLLELYASAAGRLPGAIGKLGESELRNFALLVLNANFYLPSAHGEAFNGKGKTDLLVPWQGRNAFVGEMKKYDGQKTVHGALDQLLGYLTWADTKAAYLPIITRRDVTTTLIDIDTAMRSHPHHAGPSSPPRDSEHAGALATAGGPGQPGTTNPGAAVAEPGRRRDYLFSSAVDGTQQIRIAVIPIVLATPVE